MRRLEDSKVEATTDKLPPPFVRTRRTNRKNRRQTVALTRRSSVALDLLVKHHQAKAPEGCVILMGPLVAEILEAECKRLGLGQ